jgi:hypothetical protein
MNVGEHFDGFLAKMMIFEIGVVDEMILPMMELMQWIWYVCFEKIILEKTFSAIDIANDVVYYCESLPKSYVLLLNRFLSP